MGDCTRGIPFSWLTDDHSFPFLSFLSVHVTIIISYFSSLFLSLAPSTHPGGEGWGRLVLAGVGRGW